MAKVGTQSRCDFSKEWTCQKACACSVPVNFFLARGHAIFQGGRIKYSTVIYKSTLAYCCFRHFLSRQVAVAVGFLTRSPSLIWNTDLKWLQWPQKHLNKFLISFPWHKANMTKTHSKSLSWLLPFVLWSSTWSLDHRNGEECSA